MPDAPDPESPPAPPVLSYATPAGEEAALATVARCASTAEAELCVGELADAGIPAHVLNQHTSGLGPYSGGSEVEVQVRRQDAARAAEVLALVTSDDVEPADEPPTPVDETGAPVPLAVAAAYDHPSLLRDAVTHLAAASVEAFPPRLVPRGDRPAGEGKRFLLRVREDDLDRARAVLADAEGDAGDDEEPRCPQCRAWRVYKISPGFWRDLFGLGRKPGEPEQYLCLACKYRGPMKTERPGGKG